ncbi:MULTISPECIES: serine hydrolase [Gammaproteobacteria]|uniref:serine hydrolase domain-containing protein n=1 Tax=Gammaproteobacteria TaxID=1236 RepID=UPI000DCF7A90|nr:MULTISPECIES: serine hydrolase domain-containing protein [Gammaproteobacteria]RTE85735.1 class A beta-lactamase-related serine hydrolase [Aliidiomarina sp. B3213]TCZ90263.1 class A beta-lactamase-related serine hydrolase [Lysobacter sp. N42]
MTKVQKLLKTIAVAAVVLSPLTVSANDLDGIWRGKMEIQQGVYMAIGIQVDGDKVSLQSPNQGMFGRTPTNYEVSENQVIFSDTELSIQFEGNLENGVLQGEFIQGRTYEFPLNKLDAEDISRMESFEGRYAGDLVLNGRSTLPLVLNIAVLADGYLATLDSPEQQSYGIPISDLEVSDSTLSFNSPMIQASYEGEFNGELYEGRFLQGQARVLNLKKFQRGEPLAASTNQLEVGTYGGAVAVITPDGTETSYYGEHSAESLFEIGSVTKTMVAYLLAHALEDEQVDEQTKLTRFWPNAGVEPTLVSLSTHHSGIPRLPESLLPTADPNDPYAHFGATELENALNALEPSAPEYEYSNFAVGALAEAVAQVYQKTFSVLIQDMLFAEAGMTSSYVALPSINASEYLVTGYSLAGDPVPNWNFDALAGAGAVVSSLPDMVRYVEFVSQGYNDNNPIIRNMLTPRVQLSDSLGQALGWMITTDENGKQYAWHNGQTAGFSSFVGFYLDGSRAVVILNNQSISINEEAMELLKQ